MPELGRSIAPIVIKSHAPEGISRALHHRAPAPVSRTGDWPERLRLIGFFRDLLEWKGSIIRSKDVHDRLVGALLRRGETETPIQGIFISIDRFGSSIPALGPKRAVFRHHPTRILGGGFVVLVLVAVWVLAGTPFIFSYYQYYPAQFELETQATAVAMKVTDIKLRSCHDLYFNYSVIQLKDGGEIRNLGSPQPLTGSLDAFQTKTFRYVLSDTETGAVLKPNGQFDSLQPGELAGAQVTGASVFCAYAGLTID